MEMFKRSYSHFSVNLVLRLGLRLAPSKPHYEGEHPEGRKGPAGGYHPHDRSKSWPCGLSASQRPSSTSCSPGAHGCWPDSTAHCMAPPYTAHPH